MKYLHWILTSACMLAVGFQSSVAQTEDAAPPAAVNAGFTAPLSGQLTAPIRLAPGVDPAPLGVAGKIDTPISFVAMLQSDSPPGSRSNDGPPSKGGAPPNGGNFDVIFGKQLRDLPAGPDAGKLSLVSLKAWITPAKDDGPPRLFIEATIQPDWHIYSITQPKGGPIRTKITLEETNQAQLAGAFNSSPPPKVHLDDIFKINVEEHVGRLVWSVPLKLSEGVRVEDVKLQGSVYAQACSDKTGQCKPMAYSFVARLDTASKGEYRAERSHVLIRGHVEPKTVAPGGTVKIVLTAVLDDQFHIYTLNRKNKAAKPTLIVLTGYEEGWKIGKPTTDAKPVEHDGELYHERSVSWTIEVQVPKNAEKKSYFLRGTIGYQVCAIGCDSPTAADFEAEFKVSDQPPAVSESAPLKFRAGSYRALEKLVAAAPATVSEIPSLFALLGILGSAFLGGLLLNVMPCVLPVIGIKILSVVEEAGHDRKKIFLLNVWYALGILSVFMLIALLVSVMKLGHSELFTNVAFNIGLTCLVWVMALSLLGVWEIPIPGFVGSGAAANMQTKQGVSGAFSRGIFTTILSLPCTGPFLGAALALTLKLPAPLTFAIYALVSLGMASPFLLIGAFPKLVGWLPKPGAWMDTFKQIMGLVMLWATAVLFALFVGKYQVFVFAMFMALWCTCWWIGRTPLTAEFRVKLRAWVGAVAFSTVAGILLFTSVVGAASSWLLGTKQLAWEEFSVKRLEKLTADGHTVLVDFTADW